MNFYLKKIALGTCLSLSLFSTSYGQEMVTDTTSLEDIFSLSLEELMNTKIVSASRKEESAFDSPLSSFVISKKEISAMGATSIPDALRICPSIIVREVANGSYDVSIRGGIDGLPAYSYSYNNTSILVMIDNRPVFSYLQGGTYWQNLPIGLAEIERIEVVCGPSSSLYGPNAVSGVINIISSRAKKNGNYITGIAQGGSHTNMTSIVGGRRVSDQFSMDIALNYDLRQRFNKEYYNSGTKQYETYDSLSANTANKQRMYPDDDISLEKIGASMNLHYAPNENVEFHFNSALNKNIALFPLSVGTSLTSYTNTSQNLTLNGKIHDFTFLASYLSGKQGLSGYYEANRYNYANTDIYVDYTHDIIEEKLSIKPALSYQSTYANDKEYTIDKGLSGTFNGEGTISSMAASLKIDANPIEKLRLIVAGRYDQFNYPEKGVFSYQAIANYKINENHTFRALTGKSYNGSFLIPTLISSTNANPNINITLEGNKNLDLLSNTSYELGYRTNFIKNTVIDVAVFSQTFSDFNTLILQTPEFDFTTGAVNFNFLTQNLALKAKQQGVTIAIQANLFDSKVQIRPNVTLQKTELEAYSPYYNVEGAWDNPTFGYVLGEHKDKTSNVEGTGTPSIWGGFNFIVNPIKKLTVDISGYYSEQYVLHMNSETSFMTGAIEDHEVGTIKSHFLLNANVNYLVAENMTAFVNVRNLTNEATPQGFGSDRLGINFLVGLKINY